MLAEIFRQHGDRAAIGTSGQLTGTALIDLAVSEGVRPRVFTIDTGRLFPETLAYFGTLERHYGIRIERHGPDPEALGQMLERHGAFLFFDSKAKQERCCRIRKVEPHARVLDTLDIWITGLRTDQSEGRSGTPREQWLFRPGGRRILKVAPLVDWTEERVRAYLAERSAPVHPLLTQATEGGWRYKSLGCVTCTTPVAPHEPPRAGRWRWFREGGDPKECGIHQVPQALSSPTSCASLSSTTASSPGTPPKPSAARVTRSIVSRQAAAPFWRS